MGEGPEDAVGEGQQQREGQQDQHLHAAVDAVVRGLPQVRHHLLSTANTVEMSATETLCLDFLGW